MQSSHNSGSNYVIQVTTSPTLIKGNDVEPRIELSLYNDSNQVIYLAYVSGDCSSSTGFPFFPNEKRDEKGYHGNIYGIASSGTANLRVMVK